MYRSSEARDSRFSQAGVELSQAVYSELPLEDVSQLLPSAPGSWQDEAVERCSHPEPPCEHFGQRILVKCLSLK